MIELRPRSMVVLLSVALLMVTGCRGKEGPLGPSAIEPPNVQPAPTPAPPTPYTISGVVTAYHGGPVEGIGVHVVGPNPLTGADLTSKTDAQGHYSLKVASGILAIYVSSPDDAEVSYATQYKYGLGGHDQTVNFVVHPLLSLLYGADSTLTGTIHGDEFVADDDLGGRCASAGCIVVAFDCCGPVSGARRVELTLSWTDPSRQLVFYIPDFEYLPRHLPVTPATRVCCGSPLTTVYTFNADYDRIVIGFESVAGAPAAPGDSQTFQLTARSIK